MATAYGGYTGRILDLNLSDRSVGEYSFTDEERYMYLGGKIAAAKILYDYLHGPIDPLSEANIIVVMTGPLTGTGAPSSGRFNISSVSPLTGLCASSNCGGSFGLFLKKAGYDGLIIRGKSRQPVCVNITDKGVEFADASHLWGKTTSETQGLIGGRNGKIVIGPAGENMVKYAGIFSEERTAGRAGVGAVMGSKLLKAVTASGMYQVEIKDKGRAKELNKNWVKLLKSHPITGVQLPKLGTAGLLSAMNVRHMLATRNYKYGNYDDFDNISGETMAEKYLVKNKGCITCPIQCSRVVNIDGKNVKGPEVETLGLLGSNLENNSLEHILRWNYELDELGMDTISMGSTIGFAMELKERGLWDCGLSFGNIDNLSQIFEDTAYRRGIGDLLAEGTRFLADKFGGKDCAMNVKGLELAAYEPRGAVGQGLGYAVSNRGGCHLNGGYLVVLEGLGLAVNPYTERGKAELCVMFQDLMEAVSAGGNCIFTTYAIFPGFLIKNPNSFISRAANKILPHCGGMLRIANRFAMPLLNVNIPGMFPYSSVVKAVTGMNMTFGRYKQIGERGYNLERLLNMKLGLRERDDSLPDRLTEENQIPGDDRTKVPLKGMKRKYYAVRGWNGAGMPEAKLLKRLGLKGGDS